MRAIAGNSACFSLASVNLNFGTSAALELGLNEELCETWPWGVMGSGYDPVKSTWSVGTQHAEEELEYINSNAALSDPTRKSMEIKMCGDTYEQGEASFNLFCN